MRIKKIAIIFSFGIFLANKLISQEIPPAPADKAVVYFVPTSGFLFSTSVSYVDSATLVAKANTKQYVRYECEPGNHLFWTKTTGFVEAELEVGKIYFLELILRNIVIDAWIELRPVDPSKADVMKAIFYWLHENKLENASPTGLTKESEKMEQMMTKRLKKYKKWKGKGGKMVRLEKHMYYTPK